MAASLESPELAGARPGAIRAGSAVAAADAATTGLARRMHQSRLSNNINGFSMVPPNHDLVSLPGVRLPGDIVAQKEQLIESICVTACVPLEKLYGGHSKVMSNQEARAQGYAKTKRAYKRLVERILAECIKRARAQEPTFLNAQLTRASTRRPVDKKALNTRIQWLLTHQPQIEALTVRYYDAGEPAANALGPVFDGILYRYGIRVPEAQRSWEIFHQFKQLISDMGLTPQYPPLHVERAAGRRAHEDGPARKRR
jgi:hypothetical protein